MSAGKIDKKELDGKNEKYILQLIANPCEGIDEAVVIIGSDRRGTIYGIYELSEQMGVSPWSVSYTHLDVYKRQSQQNAHAFFELKDVTIGINFHWDCLLYTSRCV